VAVVVASAAAGEIIKAGNPPTRRVGGLLKNYRLLFVADPAGRKSLRRVVPGGPVRACTVRNA
jgi:flagella basal body P-ring formation protein FlgA